MKAHPASYDAVKAVLDGWAQAYARRDLQRILGHISPDPDVLMFGTNADEKRVGLAGIRAQAERDWAQTDTAEFVLHDPLIGASGSVAWAAAEATFKVEVGGQAMAFPARFTAVLEKRDERWLVMQAHFSLPAPAAEPGSSVPGLSGEIRQPD